MFGFMATKYDPLEGGRTNGEVIVEGGINDIRDPGAIAGGEGEKWVEFIGNAQLHGSTDGRTKEWDHKTATANRTLPPSDYLRILVLYVERGVTIPSPGSRVQVDCRVVKEKTDRAPEPWSKKQAVTRLPGSDQRSHALGGQGTAIRGGCSVTPARKYGGDEKLRSYGGARVRLQ